MTKTEFFQKYYETALISSKELGGKMDPYQILAYWYWETGGGTNRGARELNNLAGIKYVGQDRKYGIQATQSGMYANYSSLEEFAKDYARVLSLSYYKEVLRAGETPGYTDDIEALNRSPYAEADYSVNTVLTSIQDFLKLGQQNIPTEPVKKTWTDPAAAVGSIESGLRGLDDEQVQRYAVIGFIAAILFVALGD